MAKALIVYSSRSGETRSIGELIGEGLRFSAVDVTLRDVVEIRRETELAGFDIYVFGSSTYHGEMMDRMKTFLFLAERAELKGKIGGAFGSYGWSGEAAERIFDTMKNIYQMEMANGPLMLKTSSVDGGIKVAQAYGKELAAKL
ncbi:flavodoxin domain-containing protein [Desulfopila aestuarii]|uniref:Flavodoxin domain-containing protein n=1 Tax=Desulfopila aestuarii DSM 18488 TaxID=1121416 RepID=A0A1M7XWG0_9BACT|nr:flavodoxin domain-containing protein [Desulfopila aestuarii]SHO43103.1 Flavodoxin domain-containing protein [Desulfopila aestuarii DSM 18488]